MARWDLDTDLPMVDIRVSEQGQSPNSGEQLPETGLPISGEIWEEDLPMEEQTKTDVCRKSTCDKCSIKRVTRGRTVNALFLCYLCESYLCAKCFEGHEFHQYMSAGSEEKERKGIRERFLNEMMGEKKRDVEFEKEKIFVSERIKVKHALDQNDCWITGLCGMESNRWAACDSFNYSIKIYKSRNNNLHRYIRLWAEPRDVTELNINPTVTETGSGSDPGIPAEELEKPVGPPCLIAVTLRWEYQILMIDVGKQPAVKYRVLKTDKLCGGIKVTDNRIFTLCKETHGERFCSVYILSLNGETLRTINAGTRELFYHVVLPGKIYLTDALNNKVRCIDMEGKIVSEIVIEGSGPEGITVDNQCNIYVSATSGHKVYKMNSDLTEYKSLPVSASINMTRPRTLCFYNNKLFVGHEWLSSLCNFVTVFRL